MSHDKMGECLNCDVRNIVLHLFNGPLWGERLATCPDGANQKLVAIGLLAGVALRATMDANPGEEEAQMIMTEFLQTVVKMVGRPLTFVLGPIDEETNAAQQALMELDNIAKKPH